LWAAARARRWGRELRRLVEARLAGAPGTPRRWALGMAPRMAAMIVLLV
jgi:hypothetical protein